MGIKWIRRSDQHGLAFPKKKKSRQIKRKVKSNNEESVLQELVDRILVSRDFYFLRIPDQLYRLFAHPQINPQTKRVLKDALAGLPDNDIKKQIGQSPFYLGCNVECKSEKGRLSKVQRERAKQIPYNIVRDQQSLDRLLGEFERVLGEIEKCLDL